MGLADFPRIDQNLPSCKREIMGPSGKRSDAGREVRLLVPPNFISGSCAVRELLVVNAELGVASSNAEKLSPPARSWSRGFEFAPGR